MAACAHGWQGEVCKHIPKEVAVEFNQADKRRNHIRSGYARINKKSGG